MNRSTTESTGARVMRLLRANPDVGEAAVYAAFQSITFGSLELKEALRQLWAELAEAARTAETARKP